MKANRFRRKRPFAAAGALALAAVLLLLGAGPVLALPTGQQVMSGQAAFQAQDGLLTVTNSPSAIIHWQAFSIGAGEAVRFVQQSSASAVLNRVTGQDPSLILGLLQSNGTVFLINPNGILFGPGSRIDVHGLVASTLGISNQDFLAGKYDFTAGALAGPVQNQGTITTPAGGKVWLVAPSVENSGVIHSPGGGVVLAAGQSVRLVDSLDPDIAVVVSAPGDRALNLGRILAESGRIGIYGALIEQRGLVSADSAVVGENGRIVLRASQGITLDAASVTTASGVDGGRIEIQSDGGTTRVSGTVTAAGAEGRGGEIRILGERVELDGQALVDASGGRGGGAVLVGGDFQGGNPDVPNAESTLVGEGVVIRADALEAGDGGKVVLWADDTTAFYGAILARGGASGGDGGSVEVSGKQTLVYRGLTDLRAPRGETGTLLLDPTNYFIQPTGGDITGAALGAQLDLANVDIQTTTAGAQNGDLYVDDVVNWSSVNRLTLSAHNDIWMNNVITNTGGGSLALRADSDASGGGNVFFAGIGHVNMTGGGIVSIFYNPPGGYVSPTDYSSHVTGVTPTAYMLVNDVNNLQNMGTNLAGVYALGTNIDASATVGWNAGAGFDPIGNYSAGQEFTGMLDGLGHTITNLFINRGSESYVGLFGSATDAVAATIRNVGLVNVNITGGFQTGGLLGRVSGTVSNCYVTGTVTGGTNNTVGGLIGLGAGSTINSYSTATVSGNTYVGGLIGANYGAASSVSYCYSTGAVSGSSDVGGLSGYNAGSITNSYWDTQTSGQATSYGGTGKTTAEMKQQATYAGWDFVNTWAITEGVTYPSIVGIAGQPPGPVPPPPPPPPPDGESSTTVPPAAVFEGGNLATANTAVALTTVSESSAAAAGDGGAAQQEEQEQPEDSAEGERKGDEKQRDDKRTTFCN